MPDPDPCAVLSCRLQVHSVEMCKLEQCEWRYARDRRERRERDAERDQRETEAKRGP